MQVVPFGSLLNCDSVLIDCNDVAVRGSVHTMEKKKVTSIKVPWDAKEETTR